MIYIIAIILYTLIFLMKNKINFIVYQLLDAFVYLITLSYIQTLDVTIVLYLIFAALPFVNEIRFNSLYKILSFLYFASFLIISILLNGVSSAISIFVIRLIGILYFVYIFNNVDIKSLTKKQIKFLNIVFLVFETIIGLIGYKLSPISTRLMLNYQCTVGCLSVSGILILYTYVVLNKKVDLFSFVVLILYCIWPILSGTRGYIIVVLGFSAIILLLYANKYIKFFSICLILMVILSNFDFFWQFFYSITGIDKSIGFRPAENKLIYMLFSQNSIINKLFGYGYGKILGSINNSRGIIYYVTYDDYTLMMFPLKTGFHNFYGTILYSSGIFGLTFVLSLFVYIIKKIKEFMYKKMEFIILILYIFLYMFILWYRWTATSGILEFASLAFCISNIKNCNVCNFKEGENDNEKI